MSELYETPNHVYEMIPMTVRGRRVDVRDHGCWQENPNSRIMNGANTFDMPWNECGREAASQGRSMWGQQAGNQCWIPTDNTMTPNHVVSRSWPVGGGPCKPEGDAWVMHLYSLPDEQTRTKLRYL